jgi:hypothetical protein
MIRQLLITTGFLFCVFTIHAQETLILQPSAALGKDGEVYSNQPTTPFISTTFRGAAWTFGGDFGIIRGLLQFDLSSIPVGSTVDSAFLSLYSPNPPSTQAHSGTNESVLRRITSPWGETTVAWGFQPSTTGQNSVTLQESDNEFQDYENIDVTELVADMVENPWAGYGFMLQLQTEVQLRRMGFASSDDPNPANHPKLVVHYTPPTCNSLILRSGDNGQDSEVYSNLGNSHYSSESLRGATWTFGGNEGTIRGFLEFDLSDLPPNAIIQDAYLSLYSPDEPDPQFHSGVNNSTLRRVTEEWHENTVTYNNQPSTTAENQIFLSGSTSEYQDYININVTEMVKDMHVDPSNSYGFMLSLETEEPLSRLGFVQGEYHDVMKHPKLEICYTEQVSTEDYIDLPEGSFYPNPCVDKLFFDLRSGDDLQLQIVDMFGKVVLAQPISSTQEVDVTSLIPSVYFLKITSPGQRKVYTGKVIKQ